MSLDPARIGESGQPGEPVEVPFRGLRRNARALAGGLILLLAVAFLVPDLSPPATQPPAAELLRGQIVEFLPTGGDGTGADVRLLVTAGPRTGETLDGFLRGPSAEGDVPRYQVGDEVVINVSPEAGGEVVAVGDPYRIPVLAVLLAIFAVAVTVVGGWRGVRSLIALALTLVVIVKIVVPLILAGRDPVWVAILAATGVTIATFLLTEGFRTQTVAAGVGTFASLALVGGLALMFDELARFTEFRGSEGATFLQAVGLPNIDIGGLLLAGIIFGALGILDDVTMTQAATVTELNQASPSLSRVVLAKRSMNAGRSHVAATVNALFLAYLGASLPLIVLFAAGRQDPLLTASMEVVAVEVVRAVVGSIGIVLAVPLTTAVAAALVDRSLPFRRGPGTGAQRARGWGGR